MRFHPLEKLINLHDNYSRLFRIDTHSMLLVQCNDSLFLIESLCPHRQHPLDLASIDAGVIECAAHHYQFALADGRLLQATEEPCRNLRTYEPVFEGNEVGVMLPEPGEAGV